MSVNGVEIEVGQRWETRARGVATIEKRIGGSPYPWVTDGGVHLDDKGCEIHRGAQRPSDLLTLLSHEKPWYPDDSGLWVEIPNDQMHPPVLPEGSSISILIHSARRGKQKPTEDTTTIGWKWDNQPGDIGRIVAYKITKAVPAHEQAREDKWRADRLAAVTAPDLLTKAADHMRARAATYDQPGGERSMGKTVAAFNAVTGRDLSEAEGWLLMAILKQVRLFSAPGYHADSSEDLISYAALLGEAKAKEAK